MLGIGRDLLRLLQQVARSVCTVLLYVCVCYTTVSLRCKIAQCTCVLSESIYSGPSIERPLPQKTTSSYRTLLPCTDVLTVHTIKPPLEDHLLRDQIMLDLKVVSQ